MVKHSRSVCVLSVVASGFAYNQQGWAATERVDLVTNTQTDYSIVVGDKAEPPERFAAEELSRYLFEISGARLRIVASGDSSAKDDKVILLGSAAPHSIWLELSQQCEDAFIIRTVGQQLIMSGACPRATLYAVYAFLESLGVGFPRPGHSHLLAQLEEPLPKEETIPKKPTIVLPRTNRLEKPSFSYRATMLFPLIKDRSLREIDWAAKNRLNWVHIATNNDREGQWKKHRVREELIPAIVKRGLGLEGIGHSFYAYIPPERYGAEHPEYFAEMDGERRLDNNRGGLCVSNHEVVSLMAENMSQFLDENPEIGIIDLWTNDGTAWCMCKQCKRMQGVPADFSGPYRTTTRSYLRFVNQVAKLLAKKHPRILVNALAYALNTKPDPETKPAANVIVGVAPWGRCTYGGSDDYYVPITEPGPVNSDLHPTILGWLKLTKNFYLYDYYSNRSEFFPIIDTLRKDYAYYQKVGIKMLSTETFMWDEFNVWAYGRLAWDHKTPLKELISQFCEIAYRPAAEPMKDFYLALERHKWEWPDHRPELEPLLKRARAKAQGDATVEAKLERLEAWLSRDPKKTHPHAQPPPPLSE